MIRRRLGWDRASSARIELRAVYGRPYPASIQSFIHSTRDAAGSPAARRRGSGTTLGTSGLPGLPTQASQASQSPGLPCYTPLLHHPGYTPPRVHGAAGGCTREVYPGGYRQGRVHPGTPLPCPEYYPAQTTLPRYYPARGGGLPEEEEASRETPPDHRRLDTALRAKSDSWLFAGGSVAQVRKWRFW